MAIVALAVSQASATVPGTRTIGIVLPTSGIDGGEGIRMRDAVLLAASDARIEVRALAGAEAVGNPHQDEGSDNGSDVAAVPSSIATAAHAGIRVVIGPLRANVATAADPALRRWNVVAVSGSAAEPSTTGTRVFKLAPSDTQLAAAELAAIRRRFGPRVCVIDDGTSVARAQTAAFRAIDPSARSLSVGPSTPAEAAATCLRGADALFAAGLSAPPVFCSAATARRAGAVRLGNALSLRSFDPQTFKAAGTLFRAQAAPLRRTPKTQRIAEHYHDRAFVAANDEALRYYAAVQIAVQARQLAASRAASTAAIMRTATFSTAIGTIRFNDNGDLREPKIAVVPLY